MVAQHAPGAATTCQVMKSVRYEISSYKGA